MLRENKYFPAFLASISQKAKEEEVVTAFNLVVKIEGEIQVFLDSYAKRCEELNIRELFSTPVQWKAILIEAAYKFTVEFDELEFSATLRGIKVARKFHKGVEAYTYTLQFEKEHESQMDALIATYLKQKEIDENGRSNVILYNVNLESIEKLQKQ
jgi:hypothetical protein